MTKSKLPNNKTHKYIQEKTRIERYDMYDLDDWIKKLVTVQASIPANAVNPKVTVDMDYSSGYYDSIDVYLDIHVNYWLELTTEELTEAKRLEREVQRLKREQAISLKEQQEAKDRTEYLRLKAKFESM